MNNAQISSLLKYILDADVLISYKNSSSFMAWVLAKNDAGILTSIEETGSELKSKPIREFREQHRMLFSSLHSSTDAYVEAIRQSLDSGQRYPAQAIDSFFRGSDPYLIAQAIAYQCTVVTLESGARGQSLKVKIPDVCATFAVQCMHPVNMLQAEGETKLANEIASIRS